MKNNFALVIEDVSKDSFVGDVLTKVMSARGVDVARLSDETGIPVPTINRLRTNKNSNPTLATLLPIANYFDITINQLIGKENLTERADPAFPSKRLVSSCVPIITIEDSVKGIYSSNSPVVTTSAKVSDKAFGITVKETFITSQFPENAILIFDPVLKPNHRDYVIVRIGEHHKPTLRQLLIDGDDYYFKPLSKELGDMVLCEKYQIIAVMIQALMNYRDPE